MKANKIKIAPFEFIIIKELRIERVTGEHAKAHISGYIRDETVEEYRHLLLADIWVTVTAEDEDQQSKIIMAGIVAGFALEQQRHSTRLTLSILSGTCLMDRSRHFRTFQTSGISCMDVVRMINKSYEGADTIAEEPVRSTPIDFLMQYQETDWAFVSRIGSIFGLAVTPAMERPGVLYYIGRSNSVRYQLPPETYCSARKLVDVFMTQAANAQGTMREQDYLEYVVTGRTIYNLWDLVVIGNMGGYVYRISSEYRQGELIHTYYLRSEAGMQVNRRWNEAQAGRSFMAVVKDVGRDLVQIKVNNDENIGQEISKWFAYSTGYSSPDGAGWYCMPEIGDQVRLQIPDNCEEHAYVISAVHMETDSGRKNPDHKSFKTKYGKELLFTPTTIELTNNQGMAVKIVDGEGIQIVSSKDISIQAGGNMTLSSENSSLTIAGTKQVDIMQGGAGMHLDEDVTFTGRKFRIQ